MLSLLENNRPERARGADCPLPRVLVAQLGARRHYAVPRALQRQGLLERVVTELTAEGLVWRWIERAAPAALQPPGLQGLLARRMEDVPASRISNLPSFAFSPRQRRRAGEATTDHWARRNSGFCRHVVSKGFGAANTVYGFNGAALEIFDAARRHGLKTILDQTAAPWRCNGRLLEEEARRWPGWESDGGEIDHSGRLTGREEAEWLLADAIICGSDYARRTLIQSGVPPERCHVVPYAGHVTPVVGATGHDRTAPGAGPLRVLFVGTLQLRKGLPYLAEAARLLRGGNVEFRFVGPSRLTTMGMARVAEAGEMIGAVPRSQLRQHYAWADVFVLPTLSEGSANVCYEAMAAGLPVITTAHAGSIVRHGHDGLIIPIRDSVALAEAIAGLARDRERLAALGEQARIGMSRQTLDGYAAGLRRAVGGTLVAA